MIGPKGIINTNGPMNVILSAFENNNVISGSWYCDVDSAAVI